MFIMPRLQRYSVTRLSPNFRLSFCRKLWLLILLERMPRDEADLYDPISPYLAG
jgi:hypothetical protein